MGLVKKPTGSMTSSQLFLNELNEKCPGEHDHVPLVAGRAACAAIYPEMCCEAICRGVVRQKKMTRVARSPPVDCPMWDSRALSGTYASCKDPAAMRSSRHCRPVRMRELGDPQEITLSTGVATGTKRKAEMIAGESDHK